MTFTPEVRERLRSQAHTMVAVWPIDYDLNADLRAALSHIEVLEAERDALRLRVAAMEAALNECVAQCLVSSTYERAARKVAEIAEAAVVKGDTTALRAMLVDAATRGSTNDGLNNKMHTDAECEAIADRILGASKGGGE